MIAGQRAHDAVLHRIEILELIHEDDIPSSAHSGARVRGLQERSGLDQQCVEVDDAPRLEVLLVLREEGEVVMAEGIATQAVCGEPSEGAPVPASGTLDTTEHIALVLIVGNAKTGVQRDVLAELAKQRRAEGVDRAALDLGGGVAEPGLETVRDLVGSLVGEGEGADAGGVDAELLDEVGNALCEAVGLAGAGAGEDEERFRAAADGAALGR